MSLRLIQTFVEVARLGSFSAAGKVLGLSPGSVSQNVKNLEDHIGVHLFERTTRQVRLTVEGERYRSRAEPALEALAEAEELARSERKSFSGTLRITATTAFGRDEIIPIVAGFQASHPNLKVDLHLSDQFVDLIGEGFDLGVRAGVLPENEYISRLLVPISPILCAAPAYLAASSPINSIEDLAGHRLIGMRSNTSKKVFSWEFAGQGGVLRQEFEPSFSVNDPAGLLQALKLGMGLGQIGSNLAQASINTGELVHVLPQTVVQSRGIYAVYPSRRFVPSKTTSFVAFLVERLRLASNHTRQ